MVAVGGLLCLAKNPLDKPTKRALSTAQGRMPLVKKVSWQLTPRPCPRKRSGGCLKYGCECGCHPSRATQKYRPQNSVESGLVDE